MKWPLFFLCIGAIALGLHGSGCSRQKPLATNSSVLPMIPGGRLVIETDYAEYRIQDEGALRTLYFIKPDRSESVASQVDRAQLSSLTVRYMQTMMGAQWLAPSAERGLLIGTGGGAMLHFLQAYFPELVVDSVDIDPAVTELAKTWFGVAESESLTLHTADGIQFIRAATDASYDIVYLDAFIKPNPGTDESGIPLRLKTAAFYEEVKRVLRPGGVVAFNLHRVEKTPFDLLAIREAFLASWVLPVPDSANIVVLASMEEVPHRPNSASWGPAFPWFRALPKLLEEGKSSFVK